MENWYSGIGLVMVIGCFLVCLLAPAVERDERWVGGEDGNAGVRGDGRGQGVRAQG